jgi:hypothetical protein
MSRLGFSCRAMLVAIGAFGCAGPALAESDICMRLEARLMALDSRSGRGEVDRLQALDRSIRKQREELDRTMAEARRGGCMGTFFQRLKAREGCGPIIASVNRMRANLSRLTAARERSAGDPYGGGRERSELVRALAANRCGEHYEDADSLPRRGGLFATLLGRHVFRERGWGDGLFGNAYGTFRTLCVRTCDGYYFPISFSAVQSHFARDEQLCRSMCPGTDVALYVHRNPGEESEAMVSLAGEPYVAMPTAFRHRREYDPACRCGRMAVAPAATSEPVGYLPAHDDPWAFARDAPARERHGPSPVPHVRPAAGEDPETLANRFGGLVPAPVLPPVSAVARLPVDGERHVRIVGPSYFYAQ